jgi:hypothetical protein
MAITVLPPDEPNKLRLGWTIYEEEEGDSLPYTEYQEQLIAECRALHPDCDMTILEGWRAVLIHPSIYTKEKLEKLIEEHPQDFPPDKLEELWEAISD